MLHCPSVIVLIICLISCLYTTQVYGYIPYSHQLTINNNKMINRRTTSQLYLFGNKASSKVVIKVDGKTITSDEKTVNLRKELMKNNVDVYPLRAKITGNNNYDCLMNRSLNESIY
jgi:hypothetical protein